MIGKVPPVLGRNAVAPHPSPDCMDGYATLRGDLGSSSLANDLSMGSHQATVHYARLESKCLLHRSPRYPLSMETPNQRLRKARLAAGYETMEAAAQALHVSVDTYRQHENDTRNAGGIPRKAAPVYAAKFKVPLQWLLTGIGPDKEIDPLPPQDEFQAMLQAVIDAHVTINMRVSDLPGAVASPLREELEKYRQNRVG